MDKYVKLSDLMEYPIRLDHYDKKHGNEHFVLGIESVLEYAEYFATSNVVVVKHGRWVKTPYWDVHRCSCCDKPTNTSKGLHNYCPNCGAKMDGE